MSYKFPFLFSLYVICLICCDIESSNINDYKFYVDQLNDKETVCKYRTDSLGSILDTLTIEEAIYDKDSTKVFSLIKLYTKNGLLLRKEYYRKGVTVFSSLESLDIGMLSVFKFVDDDQNSAMSIEFRDGVPYDTVFIEYEYKHNKGLLTEMNVFSRLGHDWQSVTEVKYNTNEDPLSELNILNNDTISCVKYEYDESGIVIRKSLEDYSEGVRTDLVFKNEVLQMEVVYNIDESGLNKILEVSYDYDSKNHLSKTIEEDLVNGVKKYSKYEYKSD